ncbi:ubiquitin-conjugating enzyme E2 22-like [Apium graveolens]|uniref:ubiquitin-conjugating enzyme E2 22-like n=1 Tax=Apium graveolens TaxID=4045 RepID=UPI003D7A03DE
MATNENLPPNVIKQLAKELKNLDETPPEGIIVGVNDEDFSTIYADIEGPAGTPYEKGIFRMKLILSRDFPHSPPKGYFLTKIFHPNIAIDGEICVNALKRDWNPNLGLRHVLIVVRCLLIEPFPESALNGQAGKMLLDNYEEYARHARIFTATHAVNSKRAKFRTGAISESDNVSQKNSATVAALHLPQTSPPSSIPAATGATAQDRSVVAPSSMGAGVVISTTVAKVPVTKKKEVCGSLKVQTDKKKIDARKKSLKRL